MRPIQERKDRDISQSTHRNDPIRDAVGKIVNCVIKKDQKSAVDFMGRAYNRPIAFDAKQVTSEDRIYFNRVVPDQEEFLDAWIQDGYSIGFILLGFTKENSYWVIPWVLWKWLKEQGNRGGKSLKLEMARTIMPELEIKQPGGGKTSVDFLPVTKRVFKIPEAPPIEKFEFKLMQGGLFDGVQS
jgi:penicillin-binding protein-related factor A (putative recombinase)